MVEPIELFDDPPRPPLSAECIHRLSWLFTFMVLRAVIAYDIWGDIVPRRLDQADTALKTDIWPSVVTVYIGLPISTPLAPSLL